MPSPSLSLSFPPGRRVVLAGALLWTLTSGCSTPLVRGLEESQANRVVVALEQAGIVSTKQAEGDDSSRWSIAVNPDDVAEAATILVQESLPAPPAPGVLEALGDGALVPTQRSEQARLVAGVAGELERSLRELDGVLTARVHLAVPTPDPLGDPSISPPSASVLIRFRGPTTPIAPERIQTLVAGAVPGLSRDHVAVVSIPTPITQAGKGQRLTRLGPIAITRSSTTPLRLLVGGLCGTNLLLVGAVLWLWVSLRSARTRPPTSQSPSSPAAPT
jgi:type III secretion protein J